MAKLKWGEFRALVIKALTDRRPDDTAFVTALAEYVLARFAQGRSDPQAYALHQNRYTSFRRSLAGYTPALSDAALQEAVKTLVRDAGSDAEGLFTTACADYVRAQRDRADTVALQRYAQSRARLAGYATTQSLSDLKAAVKVQLRDSSASNAVFADAVVSFIRAKLGEKEAWARFEMLRERMGGYTTTDNDGALQTAVRLGLSDGKRDDTEFARACALYVRAEIAREVDARDDEAGGNARAIFETCRADYERARMRLAGYTPTGGFSQASVNAFLPVESVRTNSSTYLTSLTTAATEDLKAFGTWLDNQIAVAKAELAGRDTWIDAQVTAAKADIEGLGAWVNQQVLAGRNDLQGLEERVQTEIRAGVLDLQQLIEAYRVGHSETLEEGDITPLGQAGKEHACLGLIPEGAQVREAVVRRYYTVDEVEKYVDAPCEIVAWADRQARMIDAQECEPQIALDPHGVEFVLTPVLETDQAELILVYDGIKLAFADADDVPFDEPASMAVAKFVNAALAQEWGEAAAQQQLWRAAYLQERSRLYLKHRRRAEVVG